MKTISVRKAENVVPDQIEPVCIMIDQPFSIDEETGKRTYNATQLNSIFDDDAAKIVQALKSLPGGTLSRVIGLLMLEKASQFVVPMFDRPVAVIVTHEEIK